MTHVVLQMKAIKTKKQRDLKKLIKLLFNCSRFNIPYFISWNTLNMEHQKVTVFVKKINRIKLYILCWL